MALRCLWPGKLYTRKYGNCITVNTAPVNTGANFYTFVALLLQRRE